MKTIVAGIAIALGVTLATIIAWAVMPIPAGDDAPDPALSHVNTANAGGSDYTESYFEYQGRKLHYVEAGDGEFVLFLHGFPSFWYSHIRQMDALKDNYRVVAIDGLGAGRSSAPKEIDAYRLDAMSDHVFALVEHLGGEKIHIVGHDWGAAFAFGFAQRHPDRAQSVVAMSAPPQSVILELITTDPEQRQVFSYVEQFKKANSVILLAMGIGDRIWESAYEPLVANGALSAKEGALFRNATRNPKRINAHINWYRANIPASEAVQNKDYWPARKARNPVPALFIWGSEDPIVTSSAVEEIAAISDDLSTLRLEGVGHWPHIEEADAVSGAIRTHLEKNTTPSPN